MSVSVNESVCEGFPALVMQNQLLRAVVIPTLGGRVWELEDRVRGRQWVWHREGVPLRANSIGARYDDVWAGGWEELFPNDAPGIFEGRELADHGEWWAVPWRVEEVRSGNEGVVRLSATMTSVKAVCTKEFETYEGKAALRVRYRIRSLENRPFHFLFKQHFPVLIDSDCRIALPGGKVEVVDASFGTMVAESKSFEWPGSRVAGGLDMRVVPFPTSRAREFLYVKRLPDGWCGVDDLRKSASLRMHFDRSQVPFVWLFLSYGGWRDTYTAVLEPCTNMPKDLADAVDQGQAACLAPGEEFRTEVLVELAGASSG